ncbi:MAG: hypothetical protein HYR72_23130 [Deltaproteobacteria bacterium]|nr:hypothetical protein [Deltaproteobacteria bacterium]MBI3390743.1 hypothetical protein [Deltaproteobacteria bacterium]
MRPTSVVAVLLLSCVACERTNDAPPLRLPAGSAGVLLQRAIDAAGGWDRWLAVRDVAFVTTFTLYDPVGNISSESIGIHKSPLHQGPRVRYESLGLPQPVTLGFDGKDAWMLRDGAPIREPARLALSRFNMVGNIFWFSLPFSLAELPVTITDLGEQRDGDTRWQRLKVTLDDGAPEAPGDWFVISLDPQSGLIDHVLGHITASFLTHSLWVGKWLDYQDCGGIRKERRRQFFPADAEGAIVGNMVVEQLVEDVHFNNQFPPQLFEKPLLADGGNPT